MVWHFSRACALFAYAVTLACSPTPQAAPPDAPRSPATDSSARASRPLASPPPTPSSPRPPAPSNRWVPEVPELNGDAVVWLPTQLANACERPRSVTRVIESAEVFRAAFCLEPELDWSHFRLAVFASYDGVTQRALRVVDVVRHADHWLVVVEPSGACCTGAWDCDAAAVAVIPASPLPVRFIRRASSMPACVAPRDGYGY